MPWIPLAVAGAQLAGGMMGNAAAADEREASLKQMQEAVRYLESVGVPSVEAQKLVLEEYRSAGNLTPDMEQAFTQSSNAYDDIQLSPEYKEAGLEALGSLRDIGESGGMNLMDKANMEKVLSDVGQADRGRREAAKASMGARGQLGSGLELLADLQSAQDANQTAHQSGLQIAGMAEQRALDAIRSAGDLGNEMGNTEFNQKGRAADARNAIEQFNTQARQAVETRNVGARNDAQRYNLDKDQSISNANTELRNKEQQYNKELLQKEFDNKMSKASAQANARQGLAASYNAAGDREANAYAGVGSAIGQAGNAYQKQKNTEEDQDLKKKLLEKGGNTYFTMGPGSMGGGS